MSLGKHITRVCIVEDHVLVEAGLVALLEPEVDIRVVGKCRSVEEALRVIDSQEINVILLDLNFNGRRGTELLRHLRVGRSQCKIVVVAGDMDYDQLFELVRFGVSGVILKNTRPELVAKCIRSVSLGELWFNHAQLQAILQMGVRIANGDGKSALSKREKEVLLCLLEGFTNKEIAGRTCSTVSAVKSTLQQLFHKTGVRTRSHLVRVALENYREELGSNRAGVPEEKVDSHDRSGQPRGPEMADGSR